MFPAVFWVMLWGSINTGPWMFSRSPDSLLEWLHFLRAGFPLFVLVAAGVLATSSHRKVFPGPLKLWFLYGAIGLLACLGSPHPFQAAYWGLCYLSAFAAVAAYLRSGNPLTRAVELNSLTWLVTAGMLAVIVYAARDALFVEAATGWSSYGIIQRVGPVAGIPIPRASGLGRFAAIPAIVAFVMLWRDAVLGRRLLWAALFFGTGALVYITQSRGAIFSLAFALIVVVYYLGARARLTTVLLFLAGGLAVAVELIPPEFAENVKQHVTRRQGPERLQEMTGRTFLWDEAQEPIAASPLFGWGFQADRYLGVGHVHNTYMYALLVSGFLGFLPFAGGLVWAWLALVRAGRRRIADRLGHKFVFAQVAGILAFFTMRSIPEVCGALFMVDLIVMLPAIAYLSLLDRYPYESGPTGKRSKPTYAAC